jgi:hypothetical protein
MADIQTEERARHLTSIIPDCPPVDFAEPELVRDSASSGLYAALAPMLAKTRGAVTGVGAKARGRVQSFYQSPAAQIFHRPYYDLEKGITQAALSLYDSAVDKTRAARTRIAARTSGLWETTRLNTTQAFDTAVDVKNNVAEAFRDAKRGFDTTDALVLLMVPAGQVASDFIAGHASVVATTGYAIVGPATTLLAGGLAKALTDNSKFHNKTRETAIMVAGLGGATATTSLVREALRLVM